MASHNAIDKPIVTAHAFQEVKGKDRLAWAFLIPGVTFLVSLIWYLWTKRRLLRQEIIDLHARERLLYAGSTHLPRIALTFDDGPHPSYTPQVLEYLRQYGVKATFFCVGRHVVAFPDLVKEAHAAGHVIANHSWSHPYMALLPGGRILAQLTRTSEVIQQVIGARPIFFRPPYGAFSSQVLKRAARLGMTTVLWNIRATDWARPGVDVITSRVLARATPGGIILLHDGGGDRSETVAALPTIIEELQRRGFEFVTLQQMVGDLDPISQNPWRQKDTRWSDILTQLQLSFGRKKERLQSLYDNR